MIDYTGKIIILMQLILVKNKFDIKWFIFTFVNMKVSKHNKIKYKIKFEGKS